ncbi:MAG TPA: hypothetical protein VJ831_05925 [Jatrophihabitantaceae bacterium]|nr:hypothetical protein [Jatrophihabitantaceae bacterium]
MNDSRVSKLLVWCGPVFAVLFLALSFASGDGPGEKASGAKIIDYYDDHRGILEATVFLAPLAVALLIGFAAAVRARARHQNENGVGPSIMLAGAAVWSAGMLLGSMITLGQLDASDHKHSEAGIALNDLANASWVPFIGGIAVFLVGAGITALTSRLLPAWLGWLAFVVGIVSLAGPGGFVGFFGAPLFMLIAGVVLSTRDRAPVGVA